MRVLLKQIQHTLWIKKKSKLAFESIAKTNTTHTLGVEAAEAPLFESIAKTNTTHTQTDNKEFYDLFESIAKTNTTHTSSMKILHSISLRVLLKQIQHTPTLLMNF